ncbi:MAG: hypothetical protein WA304_14380 [Candidatus Cybelea sp.]
MPLAMPTAALSPDEIFRQAQRVWQARVVPPYESFRVLCDRTFLVARCDSGAIVEFTVRMSDGRTFARALSTKGNAPRVLMQGGYISGPVETPLGFYRALPNDESSPMPSPPNLAQDPLQTIATVTASGHIYDVELSGEERIDERLCYHLTLRPEIDPDRYPLRELWIAEANFEVVQLAYERPYVEKHTRALVLYRFAPVGPEHVWSIVHIEAQASARGLFSTRTERVSDDLSDLSFPTSAPDWYFRQPPSPVEP